MKPAQLSGLHRFLPNLTAEPVILTASRANCYQWQQATLTIRKLPDHVHRALHLRAAASGRSVEAEVRAILESVVAPSQRVKLGSMLAEVGEVGEAVQLSDAEVDLLNERDRRGPNPLLAAR